MLLRMLKYDTKTLAPANQVFWAAALEATRVRKGARPGPNQKAVVGGVHHSASYAHRVGDILNGSLGGGIIEHMKTTKQGNGCQSNTSINWQCHYFNDTNKQEKCQRCLFSLTTAPDLRLLPSITTASISTVPSAVRQLPVPASKTGSSSRTFT